MAIRPDSRIGAYRVHRPIGRGGFSTVYLASDDRLDADVAIKVLADNWALDPDARSRFVTEARHLRAAAGPHLIAVHDIGETEDGQPYFVLEHAARGSLDQRLIAAAAAGVTVDADDLAGVADALTAALTTLHRLDLVHRDVTPANLLIVAAPGERSWSGGSLLDEGERLVLADLGLVKDLAAASGITAGAGTSSFTAPEQRTTPSIVDSRTDVYAASAVLATVLTGRTDAVERDRDLGRHGELGIGLRRSMSASPADRPASMEAWRSALPLTSQRRPDAGNPRSRRRTILVSALAVAMLAVVVAGVAIVREGEVSVRRETVSNGLVASSRSSDGVTLTVTAPHTVVVDRTTRITAIASSDVPVFWLTDDGPVDAGAGLDVTPRSIGALVVTAVAVLPDGTVLEVEHRATAVTERRLGREPDE